MTWNRLRRVGGQTKTVNQAVYRVYHGDERPKWAKTIVTLRRRGKLTRDEADEMEEMNKKGAFYNAPLKFWAHVNAVKERRVLDMAEKHRIRMAKGA